MRVGVVAIPGIYDSSLTSVLDVLDSAQSLRAEVDPQIPEITATTTGIGSSILTRRGLRVPIEHQLVESTDDLDLLVVPALGVSDEAGVNEAMGRPRAREVRNFLAEGGAGSARLAGACTGTFLLAEAGCLEGRRATTSWWLSGAFERRYPNVELDMSRMVVESGHVLTAGAAFAHIDLAIRIVSGVSPALADRVASRLLIDERPARSANAVLGHLATTDRLVADLEEWIRKHLADPINVEDIARELGTTRRTLERRTRARLNVTPLGLVRRLRIERANHLRRTTDRSMEQIALSVGYRNAATLRRLLDSGE